MGMTAGEAFRLRMPSPNFMTPHRLWLGTAPNGNHVELTYGDFMNRPLFGVTVLGPNAEYVDDLCAPGMTPEEVDELLLAAGMTEDERRQALVDLVKARM